MTSDGLQECVEIPMYVCMYVCLSVCLCVQCPSTYPVKLIKKNQEGDEWNKSYNVDDRYNMGVSQLIPNGTLPSFNSITESRSLWSSIRICKPQFVVAQQSISILCFFVSLLVGERNKRKVCTARVSRNVECWAYSKAPWGERLPLCFVSLNSVSYPFTHPFSTEFKYI